VDVVKVYLKSLYISYHYVFLVLRKLRGGDWLYVFLVLLSVGIRNQSFDHFLRRNEGG
jgi:hypothetical protein